MCRLKKFLYGLKQAPARCHYDNCVYFQQSGAFFIYLLLHVDDMLFPSKDKSVINKLKSQLSDDFEMKDLGAAKKILGMEIHRDQKANKLYLSQRKYHEKVLNWFNMDNYQSVSNPLATHFKLSAESCP